MGKFEITKRTNGEFQFNLKAANGEIILTSEGYIAKMSCKKGIDSARTNSKKFTQFERLTSKNKKYYFNLKAGNGRIVATSEMYESEANRDMGIDSVIRNAASATIVDLTIKKN